MGSTVLLFLLFSFIIQAHDNPSIAETNIDDVWISIFERLFFVKFDH